MWLARDKSNELFLFVGPKLPEKKEKYGYVIRTNGYK